MVRYNEIVEQVDIKKIERLLKRYFVLHGDITIDNDGFVSISSSYTGCILRPALRVANLPIKFKKIDGEFNCGSNELTSLQGCPTTVNGCFFCFDNRLISLQGSPIIVGSHFNCANNQLTSLVGCPSVIEGHFNCNGNQLKSFDGLPSCTFLSFTWNKDLPLLRLVGTNFRCDYELINAIFKKYKDNSRASILACQKELIQNGLEGNASW